MLLRIPPAVSLPATAVLFLTLPVIWWIQNPLLRSAKGRAIDAFIREQVDQKYKLLELRGPQSMPELDRAWLKALADDISDMWRRDAEIADLDKSVQALKKVANDPNQAPDPEEQQL